jgi:hypothetical protein
MWSFNDKLEQLEPAQVIPDDHKWAEYRNAELGRQLRKAQEMNAGFEEERAIYLRENDLLRLELEEVRLANLDAQAAKGPLDGQSGKLILSGMWDILSDSGFTTVAAPFPADKLEVR